MKQTIEDNILCIQVAVDQLMIAYYYKKTDGYWKIHERKVLAQIH